LLRPGLLQGRREVVHRLFYSKGTDTAQLYLLFYASQDFEPVRVKSVFFGGTTMPPILTTVMEGLVWMPPTSLRVCVGGSDTSVPHHDHLSTSLSLTMENSSSSNSSLFLQYCGAKCQKAHWIAPPPGGHKRVCKVCCTHWLLTSVQRFLGLAAVDRFLPKNWQQL
jgi:hypothetical protein